MSDNPFINPPSDPEPTPEATYETAVAKPTSRPGWLTFIFVISLLLGLMGIFGSLMVFAGPAINKAMFGMMGEQGLTDEQIEAQKGIQELADKQFIPNLIFGVANLFVASLLIFGAVGGFSNKRWTPKILKTAYLTAIVFVVLRTIYGMYVQVSTKDEMMELSMKNAGPQAEALRPMMEIFSWIGIVFVLVYALFLLVFYGLAFLRMKATDVEQYYSG